MRNIHHNQELGVKSLGGGGGGGGEEGGGGEKLWMKTEMKDS